MKHQDGLPHSQRGTALIVSLVLMTVLTILAISTMRTATLELSMAGNTQYKAQALALAEAGLDIAFDQINEGHYDPIAMVGPNADGWTEDILPPGINSIADNEGDTFQVDILYRYEGLPPAGNSMNLLAHYFELRSTGRTAARNARVVLRRGFWKYSDALNNTSGADSDAQLTGGAGPRAHRTYWFPDPRP